MQTNNETKLNVNVAEYVIVGAGPAALTAIPQLLNSGVAGKDIIWIDPQFKVGDFGSILSVGSSVPGNTSVENYQKVYKEIYRLLPACAPKDGKVFEIDTLGPNIVCSLKVAAEPMQHITNELRKIVCSVEGKVTDIFSMRNTLKLEVQGADGKTQEISAKCVILATGAKPKTMQLPPQHSDITMIDPNTVFIESELENYLKKNSNITTVAVIGSSHSAALATMHLLKAGRTVKQFMNKTYKYATPEVAPDGTKYTKFDNTGLKGEVAKFTQQLLSNIADGKGEYKNKITFYIGKDRDDVNSLLEQHLSGCSHAIAAIGYEPSATLRVNGHPLSHFKHNNKTTEIIGVPGLFGIGVAFPEEVTAISGEVEPAVGVGKFWATVSKKEIRDIWKSKVPGSSDSHNTKVTSDFFTNVESESRAFIHAEIHKPEITENDSESHVIYHIA